MNQTNGLNTMIVGPEAAGKTVLAAVLADFVARNPKYGLQFRASDYATKQYCDRVAQQLRNEEWPPSTRSGKLEALSWQWIAHEGVHQVSLIDPPGQDVRSELIGASQTLGLDQKIREAHLLILTIDVVSHQSATPEQRSQNAWIVEAVLQRFDPSRMNLIVVLTKVDQLTHKIADRDLGNREAVLGVVRELMPECNLNAYRGALQGTACAAVGVAAVKATHVVIGGQQAWLPSSPLESMGLSSLVGEIVKALGVAMGRTRAAVQSAESARQVTIRRGELEKGVREAQKRWFSWALACAAVTIAMLMLVHGCSRTVVVACAECDGDGVDGGMTWTPWGTKCQVCNGTGKVETQIPTR